MFNKICISAEHVLKTLSNNYLYNNKVNYCPRQTSKSSKISWQLHVFANNLHDNCVYYRNVMIEI